jgi:hypothetical protein
MGYDGPERKPTRLRGNKYADPGWYFIPIHHDGGAPRATAAETGN